MQMVLEALSMPESFWKIIVYPRKSTVVRYLKVTKCRRRLEPGS